MTRECAVCHQPLTAFDVPTLLTIEAGSLEDAMRQARRACWAVTQDQALHHTRLLLAQDVPS